MGSLIYRPTTVKHQQGEWLMQGPWGRRKVAPMSKGSFHEQLYRELIDSDLLPTDAPHPSNRHHSHVTMMVLHSSWIENKWVADVPFGAKLKKLREQANLTQEQLAEKSGLETGTVHQLEQGTGVTPMWPTLCAVARGLGKDIVFLLMAHG